MTGLNKLAGLQQTRHGLADAGRPLLISRLPGLVVLRSTLLLTLAMVSGIVILIKGPACGAGPYHYPHPPRRRELRA